ncbi:site-2 protease family protein [Oscillatoriales cyanobacterium LEGE 11467]|uniref:Site-2 protease family protein n=1 Tax=Zarconia navalis LEGE 11467 TaxID=1828826 RepID=A0A928Z7C7_9CYAN|nr:site-2 protease family protein [Zarconia navalis]MBE9041317.1 site-2 protease family protein [Zarconia navalis LEGE 11467]
MGIASEDIVTATIVLIALGILAIGFYRSRSFGKLGIVSWLQSVVLMAPWLLFFGLFAVGIYINLAGVLFLIVASAGTYIFLGNKLRTLSQDPTQQEQFEKMLRAKSKPKPPNKEATESLISEPSTVKKLPTNPTQSIEPIEIPPEDLQIAKGIFGIDTFFATDSVPYQDGAFFRGNLRGDPETTYTRLSQKLKECLDDRYRLFLVPDRENKPIVVILPSRNEPKPLSATQKALAIGLAIATFATTLETAGILMGFDFFNDLDRIQEVLPVSLGIWAVLVAHEIGHQVMAARHEVRISWPFFIPTWQVGSFGAINRFESFVSNRTVLFDVALAGPAAGGLLSLGMLMTGLYLSHPGSLFQIPSDFFQGSMLVGTLAKVVLGSALEESVVDIHPLVAIGWLGLVINALNLMPAGQLDGGRAIQAIYGRITAGRTTIATLIVLAIASLVNPLALYWAIVILFLQRNLESPSLNELTEPDDTRAVLVLLALFLTIVTLIPLTPSVAGTLGIGG